MAEGWKLGDPARTLEIKQEREAFRPCSGCKHWFKLWGIPVCQKHEGRAGKQVQVCDDFCKSERRR